MYELWIIAWLAVCAAFDFRIRRIPNGWILCGVAAVVFSVIASGGGIAGIVWTFIWMLGGVLLFFPLFYLRMLGAGDIKVFAVVFGMLGGKEGILICAVSFLTGALAGTVCLLKKKIVMERIIYALVYIKNLKNGGGIIPYWDAKRDGYDMTMPFVWCILAGVIVRMICRESGW